MSATAATTDSNLSGNPSDDIDNQPGPSFGSNAESAGSSLNTITKPAAGGNNPANQGGSSGNNNKNAGGGSK
jgi:hypothetical protein